MGKKFSDDMNLQCTCHRNLCTKFIQFIQVVSLLWISNKPDTRRGLENCYFQNRNITDKILPLSEKKFKCSCYDLAAFIPKIHTLSQIKSKFRDNRTKTNSLKKVQTNSLKRVQNFSRT